MSELLHVIRLGRLTGEYSALKFSIEISVAIKSFLFWRQCKAATNMCIVYFEFCTPFYNGRHSAKNQREVYITSFIEEVEIVENCSWSLLAILVGRGWYGILAANWQRIGSSSPTHSGLKIVPRTFLYWALSWWGSREHSMCFVNPLLSKVHAMVASHPGQWWLWRKGTLATSWHRG